MKFNLAAVLSLVGCFVATWVANATETENLGIRVLPAPVAVVVDGQFADWDLSGGIFACADVEKHRETFGLWFHAMYDAQNLYLLARFNDPTPLNNPGDTKLEFGWNGDSLQVRVVTGYGTALEQKGVLNAWRGRDGRDVVEFDSPPRTKNSPKGDDIKPQGAQQGFQVSADGKGYVQEIAVPWKLLTKDGSVPQPGDSIVLTIEPNFTLGADGRLSIKDVFRPGVVVNRVFTFQNMRLWGEAKLLTKGNVEPDAVRLADGRQFPVHIEQGLPVADWKGLIKVTERPGFKPIKFTLPSDGYVSLVIKNDRGEIVRQLLTCEKRQKGENTVQWDGLTTYNWQTPGQSVETGNYTWSAIFHQGIGLRWRGFASHAGRVPWDDGPGTNWGGDMAPPSSVAADGDHVLLGWGASEAGKAAVLCDLEGQPVWGHKRGGFGGAAFVGLDRGIAFVADAPVIYKVKVSNATIVPWTESGAGERSVQQLLGGDEAIPDTLQGMAVKNGKVYLSSSYYTFGRGDVADWRELFGQMAGAVEGTPANQLWAKLAEPVQTRIQKWLKTDASPDLLRAAGRDPDSRDELVAALNAMLTGPALGNQKDRVGAALLNENRQWLETQFPSIKKRTTGFVAILDAGSGKVLRRVPLIGAGKMAADDKGVYVIVEGTSLVRVDGEDGTQRTVLSGLADAQAVGLDMAGNFLVGVGAENEVRVYGQDGKLTRTIGRKGGRSDVGSWQGDALRGISGICVDRNNNAWVAEALITPRRFSRWNATTGKLIQEYFGPTHYGASGGAILPSDPNVMVGEACEWKLDPTTGRGTCTAVIDNELHSFARFCKGANGRDYLAMLGPSYIGGWTRVPNMKIFERLGLGEYRLRATIYTHVKDANNAARTEFWADRNGDQKPQADEIQTLPSVLRLGGYYQWSMFLNTDLTLYAVKAAENGGGDPQGGILQIKAGSFTEVGAPLFDFTNAQTIKIPNVESNLPSLDNRLLLASVPDGRVPTFTLFDLAENRPIWRYLNNWGGVHGSHTAPPAEPGLLRGVYGIVGTAKLPDPIGDLWAMNSNLGEWHLLTRDGYYLSRLFQPDAIQFAFPKVAKPGVQVDDVPSGMGMEDFGGSLQQGVDGRVYVQSGKTALWNMEVTGLDKVQKLAGGNLTISPTEVAQAQTLRESMLQKVAGVRVVQIKKGTPKFTGNLNNDFPRDTQLLDYQKSAETAIRSALAFDDQNLYLGWDVKDPTPWVNAADLPEYMYARGDTVDFQIGTTATDSKRPEAARGDLRLSIGQVGGKPIAVVYRKVAFDESDKRPHTFSSGVIREYRMESVQVLPDARIEVKIDAAGKRYVVEAAIPLSSLKLQIAPGATLMGDIGVTHSNPSGDDTRLRTYWSNQETGLVDDEVYELMMKPANWGQLQFQK